MFNNKFGIKADFVTIVLQMVTIQKFWFKILQSRFAVANLGRIMNFLETWTTIGLLAHTGFGLSF
jgi:OOP family OmpA-OmpF porin